MDNQTFTIASIILCSLSGWYVVLTKYLALRAMVNNNDDEYQKYIAPPKVPATITPTPITGEKRVICNHACMLHLSGFTVIFGVPFLNVIAPAMLWLWKKEQHAFLDKQGREIINFQIIYTLIQFLFLGAGTLFIRYWPFHAEKLFAFTKIARIVFSTGLNLPFNIFTAIPFFWCCVVMIRGAVAAYHGINYKYPLVQQFILMHKELVTNPTSPAADAARSQSATRKPPAMNKVHWG